AFAGAMTVSGSANLTYTGETGAQDSASAAAQMNGVEGQRWGMNKTLSFSGSGEMDNGWTVSLSTTLKNAASSAVGLTLDMGDAGSLNFEGGTSARGIGKIKDMMPTADEDVGNGLDSNGTTAGGGVSGTVSGGGTGFHYSKAMDMVEIGVGYAPKGGASAAAGEQGGPGATASYTSAFVKIDPMDGLEIGFGVGETPPDSAGDASQTDDVDTAYISYVYGPVTVAYQVSNTDTYTSTQSDDEQTRWGVLYAVNDEMSISYQDHTNDDSTLATDEEATGWSASYTVGSMTFKAHRNKGTNLTNIASMESEHTEVGVTFAF
ncbi:MAG: porin, partial [Pelagibacterales bacterium]|nr:porin [Pelagibacterales bacterium]